MMRLFQRRRYPLRRVREFEKKRQFANRYPITRIHYRNSVPWMREMTWGGGQRVSCELLVPISKEAIDLALSEGTKP